MGASDLALLFLLALIMVVALFVGVVLVARSRKSGSKPPPAPPPAAPGAGNPPPANAGAVPQAAPLPAGAGAVPPAVPPPGQALSPPPEPGDADRPVPLGYASYQKKISLLGDGGVGKTSLINRFVKGSFDDRYIRTIGTNVKKKTVVLNDEKAEVTLMAWDLQGQRNDPAILTHIYRSEGAMVVCDVTRDETFNNLPEWIALLEHELGGRVPLVILGNKADLEEMALIGQTQLQFMTSRFGATYYLTSALSGAKVEEAFTELARRMVLKTAPSPPRSLPFTPNP